MTNNWTEADWRDIALLICEKRDQWMPHAAIAAELKDEFLLASDEDDFFARGRRIVEKHHQHWSQL